eukprot:12634102-Heterocapsa_arctica.AAC.1
MVGARTRCLTAAAAARRGAQAHAWLLLERLPCVDRSRHSRRTNRFLAPGRIKGWGRSSTQRHFKDTLKTLERHIVNTL